MIERVEVTDPVVGPIVCFREEKTRRRDAREASASRLGVFEWNRNGGVCGWKRVPERALRGERPGYHVRSELRRAVVEAYRDLSGVTR